MNINTFIGNSGATCHMRYFTTGMFDLVDFRTEVTVGNNDTIFSVSKRKYRGMVMQETGHKFEIILLDVLYVRG
jgi:hypothetical protein